MAVDVIMPQMGESIFEGTITKWLKKPGDKIERDEPLFEISTDKVDAEIPSPSAGVLKEIKVSEGQTVPIQTVVALIDAAGAPSQPAAAAPSSAKPTSAASTSARPESAPTAKPPRRNPRLFRLLRLPRFLRKSLLRLRLPALRNHRGIMAATRSEARRSSGESPVKIKSTSPRYRERAQAVA